ncbi:hypothetical protein MAR_032314 [Mya arenaria]|uniref:Uncharacterized protein n=1 Tax=Mya arenaria TaxID=6604 RepID=A0ABY7F693_MYAAR|nr:hypothetical protein MAR_032314 [Mya arenaria]
MTVAKQVKTDQPAMRNGPTILATPRTNGGQRKSNDKDVMSTPRKIPASKSDAQLTLPAGLTFGHMRRNSSDRSFIDTAKKFSKDVQNNNYNIKSNLNNNNNHKTPSKARSQVNTVNGLRKYSSTLGLDTKADVRSDGSVPENADGYDSDSDNDKSHRVIQWIIGVNEVAEPPEEPLIEHVDEPPQRDTAIRIVYSGDS